MRMRRSRRRRQMRRSRMRRQMRRSSRRRRKMRRSSRRRRTTTRTQKGRKAPNANKIISALSSTPRKKNQNTKTRVKSKYGKTQKAKRKFAVA